MRLLVVSHTPHYEREGTVVGWGATVREIDHLSTLFERVIHIAPLHAEPAPDSALPYASERVSFVPVAPAGGERVRDKLSVLGRLPGYALAIRRQIAACDVVHVRCPANISLVAAVQLAFSKVPPKRWLKYAGSWRPTGPEPASYAFQRWWLSRRLHRGIVTVNGTWPGQPDHVVSFPNPCLTDDEIAEGVRLGAPKELSGPLRLLYVGRLEEAKGVSLALHTASLLARRGVEFTFDLVGDGPGRRDYERLVDTLDLTAKVRMLGWKPRTALSPVYSRAHLLLLPSVRGEGWPKVLGEGMAYGVVPIASSRGCIAQYLGESGAGVALDPADAEDFARVISEYLASPARWKRESLDAMAASARFGYTTYLDLVRRALDLEEAGRS